MDADWTSITPNLLEMISAKISTCDFVNLRAVCPTWRTILSNRPRHLPMQLPWLMLPRGPDNGEENNLGSLLSMHDLFQSKTHVLDLPKIQGKRICGTSHGWLVLEKERKILLLNPITRDQISLPSLSAPAKLLLATHKNVLLPSELKFFVKKALLSSNPGIGPGCIVMVLLEEGSWETALCKIGDDCWSVVTARDNPRPAWRTEDICFINGLFYLVRRNGRVSIYDASKPSLTYVHSTLLGDHDKEASLLTVEGRADGHNLVVFCYDYSFYRCGLLMLSEERSEWLPVERDSSSSTIFFRGSDLNCIGIPCCVLQLDGWEEDSVCFICLEHEEIIGETEWNSLSIIRRGIDDGNDTILTSHLGLYDGKEYCRYLRGPCFLWHTPTLC